MSVKSSAALLAALSLLMASGVSAQDGPSWRTDTPEREEALPEVEKPEFEFTINREDLFSEDTDVADDDRPEIPEASAEPPPVVEEPAAEIVDAAPDPAPAETEALEIVTQDSDQVAALTPAPTPVVEKPAAAVAKPAPAKFKLVRTKVVNPDYPRHARINGLEGWVELMLTVDPSGKVAGVEVIGAEPRRVFEKSALRAAMRWQFEPPRDSGITADQTGKFRIAFNMDG
jgi:protein TonB